MDLCVFCLAALFPMQWQYCGDARKLGGDPVKLNVMNVAQLFEEGWTMYTAAGQPLALRAVTRFSGTLACAEHAVHAVQQLPSVRGFQ